MRIATRWHLENFKNFIFEAAFLFVMKVRSLFSKHGHHDIPEVGSDQPEVVDRKWAGSDRKYENIQTIVDSYKVQIENRWNLFKG